ncbi:MAG: hypothetical protein WDN72_00105 [Alphaproteobacteria bacterium]
MGHTPPHSHLHVATLDEAKDFYQAMLAYQADPNAQTRWAADSAAIRMTAADGRIHMPNTQQTLSNPNNSFILALAARRRSRARRSIA